MSELHSYHEAQFDPLVAETLRFNAGLGLRVLDASNVTIVGPVNAHKIRHRYGLPSDQAGGYDMNTDQLLVIHEPDASMPKTARVGLGANLAHEGAHSGTANLDKHPFYNEALAGMSEAKYLQWLIKNYVHRPATDFLLEKADVRVLIPGWMRYLDESEAGIQAAKDDTKAVSSQGLVAALGVGYGLRASGQKSADILRASSLRGTRQYQLMEQNMAALHPKLPEYIERSPGTAEGIIKTTAKIQEVARSKGIE